MPAEPIIVVIPGDLHLTDPGLENHRVAHWMVEEVNDMIRPDFVQFIGDNVQDARLEQFRLFDDLRLRLNSPHFALVGDHDIKGDAFGAGVPAARRCALRLALPARRPIHPAQHAGVSTAGYLDRTDRLAA